MTLKTGKDISCADIAMSSKSNLVTLEEIKQSMKAFKLTKFHGMVFNNKSTPRH